jgi:hypothetical protein
MTAHSPVAGLVTELDVPCPKCGASVGRRCLRGARVGPLDFLFTPTDTAHIVRVEAAGLVSIVNKTSPHRKRRSR